MLGATGAPLIVGVVHSRETLQAALALGPAAAPDWIELRVDAFAAGPQALDALAASRVRRLLVTVRHPTEGGMDPTLGVRKRRALYARFLPGATAVDIEVRSLRALRGTADEARAAGAVLVASFHDFNGTPLLRRLREAAKRAFDAGADVFKVAAAAETPGDLAVLFALLDAEPRSAVMGMGRLGRASRPALAAAGSLLNYGFLGAAAQVPGQWPVAKLRRRIDELAPAGGTG